jgi:hypothetical protein
VIAVQLLILALMAIGAFFDDWLGHLAHAVACVALLLLGVAAAVHLPPIDGSLPAQVAPWYPLCVMVATVTYGLLVRDRRCLLIAATSLAAWLGYSGVQTYQQLRRTLAGLDQIAWGLVFFLIAAAISLKKAGLWPRSSGAIACSFRSAFASAILQRFERTRKPRYSERKGQTGWTPGT